MPHPKPEETKLAKRLSEERGVSGAAALMRVNAATLTRALCGLEIRPSSVLKLRAGLARATAPAPATEP